MAGAASTNSAARIPAVQARIRAQGKLPPCEAADALGDDAVDGFGVGLDDGEGVAEVEVLPLAEGWVEGRTESLTIVQSGALATREVGSNRTQP